MTAVVVGGTSGLGRALCEELAARGRDLVVVSSDVEDGRRLADHLRLLWGVRVLPLGLDARDPVAFRDGLRRGVAEAGVVEDLFLPMALARDDDRVGVADAMIRDVWPVTYTAVVLAIECLLPLMPTGGRVVGFGSIAAVRLRGRNVQYAAAKAALQAYFEGLRHTLATSPQVAQFYVVGFIASGQSFGRTVPLLTVSPRRAALRVLKDGRRDVGRRFLPGHWALVAALLRLMPWRVFSRLDF